MNFDIINIQCLFLASDSYKWYVPLTYVFEDSPQDPKMTWMNISSDEGLTAVSTNVLTCYSIKVN